MKFKFKFKRKWFWRTVTVIGIRYEAPQDKMVIYLENGGIEEIPQWHLCACKLGVDWKLAQQKALEAQSGQSIPLGV